MLSKRTQPESRLYGEIKQTNEERSALLDAVYANDCKFVDTAYLYGESEDRLGQWCIPIQSY
ncbi:hypothetical protein FIBSPDRAFT_869926 [Athelia psychrophila]|uniref:NADP-dependent oxidoreductase domain-containing protein n=1 Tax=Athelia psychrophila TaxID=1759441 RepID=A0A166BM69_9AGAM|nr:hypothetical protein FIBSPDRAFT_869926 [Fibularhizoctonia sp. CBS 109695]